MPHAIVLQRIVALLPNEVVTLTYLETDCTNVSWLVNTYCHLGLLCCSACFLTSLQVGQKHGGFTGMIQKACSLAQRHIWFERKVAEDRKMVAKRFVVVVHMYMLANGSTDVFKYKFASIHYSACPLRH